MKILMISCSRKAHALMLQINDKLNKDDFDTELVTKCKSMPEVSVNESISEYVGKRFDSVDAIIFVCAAAIAVRSIAPYLNHKSSDPAVVVIDETGRFCISLLSGHAGGGNELTHKIAQIIGAQAVITTATDCEDLFAIDDFARKNSLVISDWKMAKEFSADILENKQMILQSDYEINGAVPLNVRLYAKDSEIKAPDLIGKVRAYIGAKRISVPGLLGLASVNLIVGIGCRKGTNKDAIEKAVKNVFDSNNLNMKSIYMLASIDLKKDEQGICEFAADNNLNFRTFPSDELMKCEGDFNTSEFVKNTTGADNVCERSACAAAAGEISMEIKNQAVIRFSDYRLLVHKSVLDKVTVAVVEMIPVLKF